MKRTMLVLVALSLVSCSTSPNPTDHHANEEEEIELAPYMANLQRHSQKLGYSIAARNQPLAAFYLEELEEALETLQNEVPEHDGMPIAQPSRIIMNPLIESLEEALERSDWPSINDRYAQVIEGCNRCHTATEHPFVVITTPQGPPPFNQRFEPVE